MSTWGLFIGEFKGHHYNARIAPVQPLHPNTLQSWRHYDPLTFANIFVPNQLWPDTCHLSEQLHLKIPLGTCSL
jgi:hypothetical protein